MLCISCKAEYARPGDDLCQDCADIIRQWTRLVDVDEGETPLIPREEFEELLKLDVSWKQLEKLRLDAPDFLNNYIEAVKKSNARVKEEGPKWTRSSGEEVFIRDMNKFHLSGAMNRLHRFALTMVEEEGADYLEAMPPVYWHLREEMISRGMAIPRPPDK